MKKVLVVLEVFVIILFMMIIYLSYLMYQNNNKLKKIDNSIKYIKNENIELKEKIRNMEKTIKQLKHNDESNNKYYISSSIPSGLVFDKKTRGNEIIEYNNDYYVIIKMGEKGTGGYDIKVKDVEINDNDVIIYVKETEPSPGGIVEDVITYPYDLVKFNFKPNVSIIYK